MFRPRRAAILADGGLFDSVAVWRPAEVGCSVALLTVVLTRVCRDFFCFPKEKFWLIIKKDERSGGYQGQAYLN